MKKTILGLIILSVMVAAYIAIKPASSNNISTKQTASSQTKEAVNPTKPIKESNVAGAYLDYSPNVIANTTGTKLIFFHAPWCPQCRALEADIKSKGVPSGVSIIKADYDNNQALRQKYGVTIQTTLVKVDDQGNLIQKYVAYDQPNLEAVKQHLL